MFWKGVWQMLVQVHQMGLSQHKWDAQNIGSPVSLTNQPEKRTEPHVPSQNRDPYIIHMNFAL